MTRARARAFETEVTSLLSLHLSDSLETRLLPSSETLCILGCLDEGRGTALHDAREDMPDKYTRQEEGWLEMLQASDVRPAPDDRKTSDVRPPPVDRTTGSHRTSVTSATEAK